MLQRIQTIYLLVALVLCVTSAFVPVFEINSANLDGILTNMGYSYENSNVNLLYPLFVIICLTGIMIFYQMILFRNRKKQIKVGKYVISLIIIYYIVLAISIWQQGVSIHTLKPAIGAFLPAVILIFVWFANRGIKKDEELVKSIDRIR